MGDNYGDFRSDVMVVILPFCCFWLALGYDGFVIHGSMYYTVNG